VKKINKNIEISDDERSCLNAWAHSLKAPHALVVRAKIVLMSVEGVGNKVIAEYLDVTPQTVSKWRGRFVEYRCDGLYDAPRSGRPKTGD
jgi:transposase